MAGRAAGRAQESWLITGASVRFCGAHPTPTEIHTDPHTRRTRSLRPCPEADPAFAAFGAREDIESTFSDFKYRTRKKLTSTYEDENRFHCIAYMLMRLSRALSAYHKHTATAATDAIPIAA